MKAFNKQYPIEVEIRMYTRDNSLLNKAICFTIDRELYLEATQCIDKPDFHGSKDAFYKYLCTSDRFSVDINEKRKHFKNMIVSKVIDFLDSILSSNDTIMGYKKGEI